MKNRLVLVCFGLLASFAAAQNSNNPNSSNASDSKSSLGSTLKLIQDQVNKQGEIRFTMTSKNTASGERQICCRDIECRCRCQLMLTAG